jgi:hypothetical protein
MPNGSATVSVVAAWVDSPNDLRLLGSGLSGRSHLPGCAADPGTCEGARLPGGLIFIFVGVAPLPWITTNSYLSIRRQRVIALGAAVRLLLHESGAADS